MRNVKRRRRKLWLQDPTCRFCGILTILPEDLPPNSVKNTKATIEHLDSRYNPMRGAYQGMSGKIAERCTLACWKCNNDRNKVEQEQVPIEELRKRSGRGLSIFQKEEIK